MSLSVTMLPFSRATDVGCGSFGVGCAVIRQRFSDGGSGGGGQGRGLGGGGGVYITVPRLERGGQKKLFSLQCTQWAALLCVADGCELL